MSVYAEPESFELGEAELDDEYGESDDGAFESEFGEASAAAQRRRRAMELERRRRIARVKARRAALATTDRRPPSARTALAAVRDLGLESKVADDEFRRVLAAQDKRMARSEAAAVASVVSNQAQVTFQDRFAELKNPVVRALLGYAPLLLLAPRQRGSGVTRFISDPRVIGGALVGGIVFAGERLGQSPVQDIKITAAPEVAVGGSTIVLADGLDARGKIIQGRKPTFKPADAAVATVSDDGTIRGVAKGQTVITVTMDGVERRFLITVK